MTIKSIDLGSNIIEFVNRPIACPITYQLLDEPNGNYPLVKIEDSNQGLILNTELRDVNQEIIVKITNNKVEKLNDKYKISGLIGVGNVFKVERLVDGVVIFSFKIDPESVKVTGLFNFLGREINVTDEKMFVKSAEGVLEATIWGNRIRTSGMSGIRLTMYGFAI